MHQVVVAACDLKSYRARGYQLADDQSAAELPECVPLADRVEMFVVEIEAEKHEHLNSAPKGFAVQPSMEYAMDSVRVRPIIVLNKKADESETCVAAWNDGDHLPMQIPSDAIFETETGAVAASAEKIREHILLHRAAVHNLNAFLRKYGLEAE